MLGGLTGAARYLYCSSWQESLAHGLPLGSAPLLSAHQIPVLLRGYLCFWWYLMYCLHLCSPHIATSSPSITNEGQVRLNMATMWPAPTSSTALSVITTRHARHLVLLSTRYGCEELLWSSCSSRGACCDPPSQRSFIPTSSLALLSVLLCIATVRSRLTSAAQQADPFTCSSV